MSCESGKMKWTMENTCKVIELYRENPLLWDPTNQEYKNRYKKSNALKEIATALSTSVDEVERKIRNINSQYRRERRNYKKMKMSGAGRNFHAKWFGYSLLSFLRDKYRVRNHLQAGLSAETQETDSSEDDNEEDEMELQTSNIEEIKIEISDETELGQTETQDTQEWNTESRGSLSRESQVKLVKEDVLHTVSKKNAVPPQVDENQKIEEVYNIIKLIQNDRPERVQIKADDFDVFGDLVARKLRGLRTRYAQCTAQHLINNLLYEAEIGNYDTPNNNSQPHLQQQPRHFITFPAVAPSMSSMTSHSNPPSADEPDISTNPTHTYAGPSYLDLSTTEV